MFLFQIENYFYIITGIKVSRVKLSPFQLKKAHFQSHILKLFYRSGPCKVQEKGKNNHANAKSKFVVCLKCLKVNNQRFKVNFTEFKWFLKKLEFLPGRTTIKGRIVLDINIHKYE